MKFNEFDLYKELGKPIGNRFYITKEVSPLEREKLSKIGFRNYSMPNPKKSNGFIPCFIFNHQKKEKDYHFCLKNWFTKEFDGKAEVLIKDSRVDFVVDNIAFEIETGANKDSQIAKKIKLLDEKYTNWFIICKRDLKAKYSKFTSPKHLFTPSEAYKYLAKHRTKNK